MCERLLAEPHHVDGEAVGRLQGLTRTTRDHVATGDVDLVVERDRDGLPRLGRLEVRDVPLDVQVVGDDAIDHCGSARVGDDHRVALRDATGDHGARVAAEVALGAHDELHREAERLLAEHLHRLPRLERTQEGRALVPGHLGARSSDVVAHEGADGDRDDLRHVEARGRRAHDADDLLERGVLVSDEVHLVDGHDHRLHAHERADGEVAMRLRADSARGIDHEDGHIAVGCGHRHVARVLLVPGRVRHEDTAAVGQVHVPVGDVDGDALLALGLEPVGEEGEVDLPHGDGRPAAPRPLGVLQRVDRHRVGLRQQPPDERGLAVVDRAAGHQVQDRGQVQGGARAGH